MRNRIPAILLACLLALGSFGALVNLTPASARMAGDQCEVRVRVNGDEQWQAMPTSFCTAAAPTPTSTPIETATTTATMAMPMPTETGTPAPGGWHAPTTHEHGDSPPAWVLASSHQPFTQTRESHAGYKGVYQTMGNGVESYLITHILTTNAARSHGDHDYQLWVLDPQGGVSYWGGQLDFGTDRVRTVDDGQRPIMLAERNATDGCEVWYSRPGAAVVDVGWTICNRYQKFDGTILGGVGAKRTMEWAILPDRFGTYPGAAPTLAQYCVVEFGVCRFRFVIYNRDYNSPGLTPINRAPVVSPQG
jgi:hypothetical protein